LRPCSVLTRTQASRTVFNVRIRTQGHDLLVEGESAGSSAWIAWSAIVVPDADSYKPSDKDVKTASDLVAQRMTVDLRDHF
jgi:hypothetical protein